MHFPEFKIAILGDRPGIAGGTAVVGLEDRVAAAGQELGVGVEIPDVTCPWAAVGIDHERGLAAIRGGGRQRQVALQHEAVSGGKFDRPHDAHLGRLEPRRRGGEGQEGLRFAVVDDEAVGFAAVGGADHEPAQGAVAIGDIVQPAGHLRREHRLDLGEDWVDRPLGIHVPVIS